MTSRSAFASDVHYRPPRHDDLAVDDLNDDGSGEGLVSSSLKVNNSNAVNKAHIRELRILSWIIIAGISIIIVLLFSHLTTNRLQNVQTPNSQTPAIVNNYISTSDRRSSTALYECKESDSAVSPLPSKGVRVLVTGAAGFIASHVANYCLEKLEMEVIAVDDMSGGFQQNVNPKWTFVRGDLKDDEFVEKLFEEYGPFKYVYHLAAYAAEGMSHFIRKFNYRNNLVSSVSVLNQAILSKVDTFVFTSSIAAYGPAQTPMVETTVPQPEDPYGVSKYAMELDLKAAHEMFGINYVIFRPHNVYGPHQNIFDRYRNVIGIFMLQILSGKPLTIFGDGLQTRAFSYIDDVAPAIAMSPLVPKAKNEVFNVGAEQPYTLNYLSEVVSEAMGVPGHNVVHLDARKEVEHAESDHTKIRCIFHLKKSNYVDLTDGIQKMADWVKQSGKEMAAKTFKEVEVLQNMPPSWVSEEMKEAEKRKLEKLKVNGRD